MDSELLPSRPPYKRLSGGRKNVGLLIGVILTATLGLSAWAFGSAMGSAPDDDYHLTSVWCSGLTGDTCDVEPTGQGVYIPEALREGIYCYYHNPKQSAGCQPILDGTDPRPDVPFAQNNQSRGLYPDGYYQFQSLFKVDSIQATALNIRFVNLSLFLVVGVGLFFALPSRLRNTWVWMWVLGLVPLGLFIIPSSNPSSWAITGVAAGWIALLGYLETSRGRSWLLGGIFLAMAGFTVSARIDSVLYLAFASVLAIWLSPTRGRALVKKMWPAVIAVPFVAVQLFLNPANLERVFEGIGQRSEVYENPLPWVSASEVLDGSAFDWALLWNNLWEIPGLWLGVFGGFPWGSLGWLDTAMPQVVLVGTMTVLGGVLFVALRTANRKKILALLVALSALWFMPLYLLQLGGFQAGEEVQPRYLIPLMMVFLGVVVLTPSGAPIVQEKNLRWLIVAGLGIANAVALHTNIRRYTTGVQVQGFNLDSPREWWWPFFPDFIGPTMVWAVGTLAFAALVWLLLFRVVPAIAFAQLPQAIEPRAASVVRL
ncbi:MAG: hypothetical protein ACJAV4_000709 [Pontimonas sp.]|jgi:hypothetical protein